MFPKHFRKKFSSKTFFLQNKFLWFRLNLRKTKRNNCSVTLIWVWQEFRPPLLRLISKISFSTSTLSVLNIKKTTPQSQIERIYCLDGFKEKIETFTTSTLTTIIVGGKILFVVLKKSLRCQKNRWESISKGKKPCTC